MFERLVRDSEQTVGADRRAELDDRSCIASAGLLG
jgi:hypothetical protein